MKGNKRRALKARTTRKPGKLKEVLGAVVNWLRRLFGIKSKSKKPVYKPSQGLEPFEETDQWWNP